MRRVRVWSLAGVAVLLHAAALMAAVRLWSARSVARRPAPPPSVSLTLNAPLQLDVHVERPLEAKAPAAPARFGPCPAPEIGPDRAVGRPLGDPDAVRRQLTDAKLEHVTASPTRSGLLAAWSAAAVQLSDDDGRTFRPVLAAPGDLQAVRIDCLGNVFALAEPRWLGVRAEDGAETWRELPFLLPAGDDQEAAQLEVGGGVVGVFQVDYNSHLAVALSHDGGVSFTVRRHDSELMEYLRAAVIDPDGVASVAVTLGDCMYDGFVVHTLHGHGGASSSTGDVTGEGILAVGHDRWVYTANGCEPPLCALAPGSGRLRPVSGTFTPPLDDDGGGPAVLTGPAATFAVVDLSAYELRSGRARRVATGLPSEVTFEAVDAAGRLLGVSDGGALVRWSRRHGARVLGGAEAR